LAPATKTAKQATTASTDARQRHIAIALTFVLLERWKKHKAQWPIGAIKKTTAKTQLFNVSERLYMFVMDKNQTQNNNTRSLHYTAQRDYPGLEDSC
jgi:hypothetical protein